MKTEHCMKCGTEIWGNRVFKLKICDAYSLLCPACVKEFALDILGKVWLVEQTNSKYDAAEAYEGKYTAQTQITVPEEEEE